MVDGRQRSTWPIAKSGGGSRPFFRQAWTQRYETPTRLAIVCMLTIESPSADWAMRDASFGCKARQGDAMLGDGVISVMTHPLTYPFASGIDTVQLVANL